MSLKTLSTLKKNLDPALDKLVVNTRCKVCKLTYTNPDLRAEIEERLRNGESAMALSRELRARGIDISHNSLSVHRRKHMPKLAAEQLKNLKEEVRETTEFIVDKFELLKENLETAKDLISKLQQIPLQPANANAISRLMAEIRQTIELITKLTGELSTEGNITIVIPALAELFEEFTLEERIKLMKVVERKLTAKQTA